jgi:hypothetical protein
MFGRSVLRSENFAREARGIRTILDRRGLVTGSRKRQRHKAQGKMLSQALGPVASRATDAARPPGCAFIDMAVPVLGDTRLLN